MSKNVTPIQDTTPPAVSDDPLSWGGEVVKQKVEQVISKYLAAIAFFFSALLLLVMTPLTFLLGISAGAIAHYRSGFFSSKEEPWVSSPFAVSAIVGAVGALIQYTPAGAEGGLLFRAIPLLSSATVGWTLYGFVEKLS